MLETVSMVLEFLIGEMVEKSIADVKVLTTNDKWFGMTYQEDRQLVRDAIAEKIKSGYYPEKLWEK